MIPNECNDFACEKYMNVLNILIDRYLLSFVYNFISSTSILHNILVNIKQLI